MLVREGQSFMAKSMILLINHVWETGVPPCANHHNIAGCLNTVEIVAKDSSCRVGQHQYCHTGDNHPGKFRARQLRSLHLDIWIWICAYVRSNTTTPTTTTMTTTTNPVPTPRARRTHTHTYTHTHTRIHLYMYTCIHVYTYACAHVSIMITCKKTLQLSKQ